MDLIHVDKAIDIQIKRLERMTQTAIRLAVKKELRGKVAFSELDNLLKEVIEQAEGQYSEWPLVG